MSESIALVRAIIHRTEMTFCANNLIVKPVHEMLGVKENTFFNLTDATQIVKRKGHKILTFAKCGKPHIEAHFCS